MRDGFPADAEIVKDFGQTMSSALAARIRDDIHAGTLKAGARLRQSEVARRYSISTTPVREAFMMLEREGLLTRSEHRGVVVANPSVEEVTETYLIRIPLEVLATEHGVPNLTDDDIDRMAEILEQIDRARESGDRDAMSLLNEEFHSIIYEAARLPRLLLMISRMRAESRPYIKLYRVFDPTSSDLDTDHQEILDACRARDAKRAAKAMRTHLEHTLSVVSAGLANDPERPSDAAADA